MSEKSSIKQEVVLPVTFEERNALWAKNLAERSGGIFTLSDQTNPDHAKYQDFSHHYYPYDPVIRKPDGGSLAKEASQKFWVFTEAAKLVAPGSFSATIDSLTSQPELLEDIKEKQRQGKKIVIPTNHPSLLVSGLTAAALMHALDDQKVNQQTAMVLNKPIGWLDMQVEHGTDAGPRTMNSLEVLNKICGIYTTLADSDNAKKFGLDEYAADFNLATLRGMTRDMHDNKISTIIMSPSGSLDVMPTNDSPEIVMKSVSPKTSKMIGRFFDYSLPFTMWFDPKTRELKSDFSKSLIPIENESDIHFMMEDMTKSYYELVNGTTESGGVPVRYDNPHRKAGSIAIKNLHQ